MLPPDWYTLRARTAKTPLCSFDVANLMREAAAHALQAYHKALVTSAFLDATTPEAKTGVFWRFTDRLLGTIRQQIALDLVALGFPPPPESST